ncbi:MAG TPA: GIY-YIG nuclease family protein [Nitrosopumilaceae archaeon]|jgi:group I intron endonuclease|nr:GIY-YIG nuclease family protein [Nitrosopumilaceae archaeon]
MEKKIGVYVIKNIVNGKYYVGSASNLKTRWTIHKNSLIKNEHHSIKLQRSFNKHGINSFIFEPIQYCSKESLIINEQYWIDHFDSYNKGYNCVPKAGSTIGYKHTEDTKKRMSLSKIGIKLNRPSANKGKKMSEEQKLKISISNKGNKSCVGRKLSKDHIEKIMKSNIGRQISKETRNKMSISQMGNTNKKNKFKNK